MFKVKESSRHCFWRMRVGITGWSVRSQTLLCSWLLVLIHVTLVGHFPVADEMSAALPCSSTTASAQQRQLSATVALFAYGGYLFPRGVHNPSA